MIAIDKYIPSGAPKMTKECIQEICREQKLFQKASLNDILYLHYQGFTKIQNLEEYKNLRSLWLQCNGIKKIENLEKQTELRFINLNNNIIDKIENLEILNKLVSIDLGHNMISKIENLSKLPNLQTLDLTNNYIETMEDIEHLRECQSLRSIDLAHNSITDSNAVEIFANIAGLKTLSLIGNPIIGKIRNYRRIMILKCKNLTALDERLINTVERKAVEAWAVEGVDAEQKVYEEDNENKRKQRKEWVDDLMRNRIIIREKAQAKWKKKKEEKIKRGECKNIQFEDEIFFPDLQGSEDSSLSSLSGIEDLYDDNSESESEFFSSEAVKKKQLITPPNTDATLPLTEIGKECDKNYTNGNETLSEEINKISIANAPVDDQGKEHEESLNQTLSITENLHNINEYKLDKTSSKEQLDQTLPITYLSDEDEFFHPTFEETEIDKTKLDKLFEELFLNDEEEKLKFKTDIDSPSDKSTESETQNFLKEKNNEYINDLNSTSEKNQQNTEHIEQYNTDDLSSQNKSNNEQYHEDSHFNILNLMKQIEILDEEISKINVVNHNQHTIINQNHTNKSYKSDSNMKHENKKIVEGMEEYRIRRGKKVLEKICQTPIPCIKYKQPSMKKNLKQAKKLFEQLF